jgi:hypothetical protein
MAELPDERQQTCKDDYAIAAWSWDTLLKPHRRAPDQPKTRIDVIYGEGKGKLEMHARAFKELQFLEMISDMAAETYVWRAPFSLEMQTCGRANATWSAKTRKVLVCYELVSEFAELYREFAKGPSSSKQKRAKKVAR